MRMAMEGPDRSNVYLKIALGASIAAHAVLLSVKFVYPELKKLSNSLPIDVILVNSKSPDKPLNSSVLAQANLAGGGNTDEDRRIKTPLPMQKDADVAQEQELQQATQRRTQLEAEAQKLMSQLTSKQKLSASDPTTKPEPQQAAGQDAQDLVQKSLAMARLEGQISKDIDTYQKRPRKNFVGATAKEAVTARYLEDWRAKIERIGSNLYPEEAKRRHIYGSLRLTVEINADGSVASVEVTQSSGSQILDDAAKRIVRQAGPYAPFSPEMRKLSDVLSITRTWTFTTSDRLESRD